MIPPSQGRILIADDDSANCDLLRIILEKEGYQVEVTSDGRATLERLKTSSAQDATKRIDLLLLDLMMPVVDGYQVLRVMKLESNLRHIPVIVITAVGRKESVQECVGLGAADYLLKPFDPEVVRSRVALILTIVAKQEAEKELARQIQVHKQQVNDLANIIIPRGLALSNEADTGNVLEKLTLQAMNYCRADAGICYSRGGDSLSYEVVRNKPLNIAQGGSTGVPCSYPPLHILSDSSADEPNTDLAVTMAAYTGKSIRVNVNEDTNQDRISYFTTRFFDENEVFSAQTFLYTPIITPSRRVTGMLEIINARDVERGFIMPFDDLQEMMVSILCRFAAQALEIVSLRKQIPFQSKKARAGG